MRKSSAQNSSTANPRAAVKPARRPRARFSDDYEVLLLALIEARQKAGVTQKEIALRLGKDRTHVSKVEHRERELNLVDMRLWCDALGLRMSDVIREWEETLARSKAAPTAPRKATAPQKTSKRTGE